MERHQNIHNLQSNAEAAGMTPDTFERAVETLCRLRDQEVDNEQNLIAAMDDITKYRQIEMAVESAYSDL